MPVGVETRDNRYSTIQRDMNCRSKFILTELTLETTPQAHGNAFSEIVRQAWQALTIMRIVVNKVSRSTTRCNVTAKAMAPNVFPPGRLKVKVIVELSAFQKPRAIAVLRPKWASGSPSQGPSALGNDVKTGSEA